MFELKEMVLVLKFSLFIIFFNNVDFLILLGLINVRFLFFLIWRFVFWMMYLCLLYLIDMFLRFKILFLFWCLILNEKLVDFLFLLGWFINFIWLSCFCLFCVCFVVDVWVIFCWIKLFSFVILFCCFLYWCNFFLYCFVFCIRYLE